MALDLKPLTLTDILDRAVRLYRENFLVWLGIAAVVLVPESLIVLRFMPPDSAFASGTTQMWAWKRMLLLMPLMVVASTVVYGAMAVAVAGRYLDRPVTIREAYARTLPRLGSLIGANILWVLVVSVGTMLFIIPGIYFFLAFVFAPIVVVLEGLGPRASLHRSRYLSRSDKMRIFLLILLVVLVQLVIQLSLKFLVGLATDADAGKRAADQLTSILITPLWQASYVLLYFDNRVKKEGFDLQMLIASQTPR